MKIRSTTNSLKPTDLCIYVFIPLTTIQIQKREEKIETDLLDERSTDKSIKTSIMIIKGKRHKTKNTFWKASRLGGSKTKPYNPEQR